MRLLLVISGGIAAYKSLELIRLLRKSGHSVRCILTGGGEKFITPLSVASLSGEECYTDLWSLKDETEMGHIRLSREADMIVIAPASANMIAKMANGIADDLASTTVLAANKPILIAPAMNVAMWNNPAVRANIETLRSYGIRQVGPGEGEMACGEFGPGRMAEPEDILAAITSSKGSRNASPHPLATKDVIPLSGSLGEGRLKGLIALVTSGPTHEPIDPVRFMSNRSSGKQGHAIAAALAAAGAHVTLVTGPVALPDPSGVTVVRVETADQMLAACKSALPVDIAVCTAAVADWTAASVADQKIKKCGARPPDIRLKETPDILATLARPYTGRPKLVVGFAAETSDLVGEATKKRKKKNCDWILANDVSEGVFGSDENHVHFITADSAEDWGVSTKQAVAETLSSRIAAHFAKGKD